MASESLGMVARRRATPTNDHGTATIAVTASIAPPALHRVALSHSPRTTCDQEVVIPQEGQGFWKSSTNVQGGRPSCWCVPRPAASGWSHRAMPSIARSPRPKTASDARARDERVTSRTSAPYLEKRAENSPCRLTSQYRFEFGGRVMPAVTTVTALTEALRLGSNVAPPLKSGRPWDWPVD